MWKFKELTAGDPERDPHEAEFFHLNDAAESVVREVIQNSLDAKYDDKAIIHFSFGVTSKENIANYLHNLDEHLKATAFDNPDYFDKDELPFLAIEDFGTTGLDGQTGENGERPKGKNNFYNFWWYEGKSEKKGKERGRWGLGKTTFHVASKIRSFWGLTIRNDDRRKLLMGKALLKTHKLGNKTFNYNGYYTDESYNPFSDEENIKNFSEYFSLLRDGEPGFSLVIPLPHAEIKPTAIMKSVMIHYFYPILKNNLEIILNDNGNLQELNSRNFIDLASKQDWNGTSWEKVNVKDLMDFINNAIKEESRNEVIISDLSNPQINSDSFGENLEKLREDFNSGKLLAFKVPVEIQEVKKELNKSYFEVFIQKNPLSTVADEYYIRSGITISDIKLLAAYPVKALFIADDDVIANFLGDAETPAHTDWKERTEEFREKYEKAPTKLRFIKRGLQSIVNIIYLPPKEQKRDFLKELFYVNVEKEHDENDDKEKSSKKEKNIPPPKPKRYYLNKIIGGFKITRTIVDIDPPLTFRITCAYDTRKGNPFKNYEKYDFDVNDSSIKFQNVGCEIIEKKDNKIELSLLDKDFSLEVSGFDLQRDLIVDIREVNV